MDAANRRPQLPALSYLDVDKVKREEEAYQNRVTGALSSLPAVTATSPAYPYPPGPPPPYSQPPPATSHHANAWPGAQSGVHTPPVARRTSGEEQDAKQTARQSLPSISEALGVDSQTSYSSSTPAPPLSVSAHQLQPSVAAPSSPIPGTRRSYGMEPPAPSNAYANTASYPLFAQYRQDPSPQQSYAPPEPSRLSYASERSPLHVHTSQAPRTSQPPSTYSHPSSTSPHYEQPSSQSAGSMAPPSIPYGYTPYPPRYAQPTPPSSNGGGPIYQPSANYPAPSTPATSWKPEGVPKFAEDRSTAPADYGASVKRQLEFYDLEGALNAIAQTSSITMDFSRRYGDHMHQTARTGPSLSTLPGLVEVDDMISKSRVQMDSFLKIREVIVTQQAAYEQQAADQRHQQKTFAEPPSSDHDPQEDIDDSKSGFGGSDTKKRRGRAAPPGRCHSCNRAETPEWRRGPDGARTLCNACGLHYAKLTRKQQQGAGKGSAVGSSNLRPKET